MFDRLYTAKNQKLLKTGCSNVVRAALLLGQHCSMLSTILFGIVTPDCRLSQAQQYCSILLTTRNNVAPTTLLHPVFNNIFSIIFINQGKGNTKMKQYFGKTSQICQQKIR